MHDRLSACRDFYKPDRPNTKRRQADSLSYRHKSRQDVIHYKFRDNVSDYHSLPGSELNNFMTEPKRIRVIDSHTGGEPTRTVISGGPDLGSDTLMVRRERFREEFDHIRSAITNEPRGSDSIV